MKETIKRGDVAITLYLNADRSVNLSKKMEIDYPGIDERTRVGYPDGSPATIDNQFEYVKSLRKFDEVFHRKKIGQRIKQLREEAGLSQNQLADMVGMLQNNIARIESGKYSTGQDILSNIANALGKNLDII